MVSPTSSSSRRLTRASALLALAIGLSHHCAAAAGTYCMIAVTEVELNAGLQIGTDPRCPESKASGCISALCRYCRWANVVDPTYADYITCAELAIETDPFNNELPPAAPPVDAVPPVAVEPVPVVPVPAAPVPVVPVPATPVPVAPATPSVPLPPVVTAPSVPPPPSAVTDCPFVVSEGNLAAGIQLVGDPTCATVGGIGCYKDVCRYCSFGSATTTSTFFPCSRLGYSFSAASPAPASGPVTTPVTSVVPTPIPTPARIPTSTPSVTPARPPIGSVSASTGCPFPIASGDFAAGIQLVGDATCAKGGRGCYQNVCRFCKFRNTDQSKHMVTCASLGYAQFGNPGEAPVDGSKGCPFDVSEGDAAVGIDLVGDATCRSGGLGCFENVCRYCKVKDTPQSAHLLKCSDVVRASTVVLPGFRLAAKEASVRVVATSGGKLDALLKDKTFKWSLVSAACAGVVAAVALVALGAKRVITRRIAKPLAVEDVAEETVAASQPGKTAKSPMTVVAIENGST